MQEQNDFFVETPLLLPISYSLLPLFPLTLREAVPIMRP